MTPLAAALLVATVGLHPVEGATYRADTVEIRAEGAASRRFHISRRIVFHREDTGFRAEVTLDTVEQDGKAGALEAGSAALLNRTLLYHLDASGAVAAIDDLDALIDAVATGMERADPVRGPLYARPLRALPPERKRALLGSVIAVLIRPGDAHLPDGQRAVTLPARAPMPPGSTLAGDETVSHHADIVAITTHAGGAVDFTPPGEAAPSHAAITLDTVRRIDTATGLLIESHATTTGAAVAETDRDAAPDQNEAVSRYLSANPPKRLTFSAP